jgi:hypothetical protein
MRPGTLRGHRRGSARSIGPGTALGSGHRTGLEMPEEVTVVARPKHVDTFGEALSPPLCAGAGHSLSPARGEVGAP